MMRYFEPKKVATIVRVAAFFVSASTAAVVQAMPAVMSTLVVVDRNISSAINSNSNPLYTSNQSFDANAVFQKAVTAYKGLKTVKIDFTQTITSALTGAKSTSKGQLLRKSPGLFSINFLDPASDRIVSDGKHLWIYLPSSAPNQVIRSAVKQGARLSADPLDLILSASDSEFKITAAGNDSLNGARVRIVKLVPVSSNKSSLRSAMLWIDERDGTVRKLETTEASGLKRSVVVTKYQGNPAITDKEFEFKPTKKMRVVEG